MSHFWKIVGFIKEKNEICKHGKSNLVVNEIQLDDVRLNVYV